MSEAPLPPNCPRCGDNTHVEAEGADWRCEWCDSEWYGDPAKVSRIDPVRCRWCNGRTRTFSRYCSGECEDFCRAVDVERKETIELVHERVLALRKTGARIHAADAMDELREHLLARFVEARGDG